MRDRGDDFVLVDVREPHEFAICALPGLGQDPARDAAPEPEQALDRGRDRRPLQDGGPQREGRAVPPGGGVPEGEQPRGRHRPLGPEIEPSMPRY